MQGPNKMIPTRRSSRIEELIARKKAEHAKQVAKLEAEAKAAEKLRRKKPIKKRGPSKSKPGTKAPVGGKRKGEQSTGSGPPRKKAKTDSEKVEGEAEFDARIVDEHQQDSPPPETAQSPVNEGNQFLQVIVNIVWTLRSLRRKRAARRTCLTKLSDLDELMDYHHPALLNVPNGISNDQVRGELREDISIFQRNVDEQHKQEADLDKDISNLVGILGILERRVDEFLMSETLPAHLPPSIRDNADIRESLKHCRSLHDTFKDVDSRRREVEREWNTVVEKYDSRAEQMLLGRDDHEPSGVDVDGGHPLEQILRDSSRLHAQQEELEVDVRKAGKMFSVQKIILARLVENDLIECGVLQPYVHDGEEPEDVEQQTNTEQAASEIVDAEELKAQHDALKEELLSAQGHLCEAEEAFKHSRELTEEDIAQLPKSMTEDEIGLQLWRKLCRTTQNYREAQERVKLAQAKGRRLRVPGVDRYPIDQTWDFEDRPEDGYADSAIADRVEKSKPRVEEWLPQLAMSGKPFSPSALSEAPSSVPEIGTLQLGEDKADGCPSDGVKERIARYQEACEELRKTGEFPTAVPDPFILPENKSRRF